MDGEEGADRSNHHRAEAALELLKSLAGAGEDPEQFAKACTDWARLSDDAISVPEFQSVMTLLSQRQSDDGLDPTRQTSESFQRQNLFELDANGIVVNISRELSQFVSLKVGDVLNVSQVQAEPAHNGRAVSILEVEDRFGITRKIKVQAVFEQQNCVRMIARAGLFKFSQKATARMREEYDLTNSEIEILELTLRRLNLEQIASWRGVRLSTVRTHVSRTISKLGCHSLVEAITTALELSSVIGANVGPVKLLHDEVALASRRMVIGADEIVEYRRFGSAQGRPVIVLHSLEYGYMPSQAMILVARELNINLIFPLRPGFGATSASQSEGGAHRVITRFIEAMDLVDVTLVGLSTAAPLALQISRASEPVRQLVLVNYGLNVADKLKDIQPAWIRGMLRMALNSPASFKIGLGAIRSIVRSYGGLRFYRRLYRNQTADEKYLSEHLSDFEQFAEYLFSSEAQSVRHDIVSAFLPNRAIEGTFSMGPSIRVLNSSNQHGVETAETKQDAVRLDVAFTEVPCEGRNWPFQHPRMFFQHALS